MARELKQLNVIIMLKKRLLMLVKQLARFHPRLHYRQCAPTDRFALLTRRLPCLKLERLLASVRLEHLFLTHCSLSEVSNSTNCFYFFLWEIVRLAQETMTEDRCQYFSEKLGGLVLQFPVAVVVAEVSLVEEKLTVFSTVLLVVILVHFCAGLNSASFLASSLPAHLQVRCQTTGIAQ